MVNLGNTDLILKVSSFMCTAQSHFIKLIFDMRHALLNQTTFFVRLRVRTKPHKITVRISENMFMSENMVFSRPQHHRRRRRHSSGHGFV